MGINGIVSDKLLSYLTFFMYICIDFQVLCYLVSASETNYLFIQNLRNSENISRNLTFVHQLFDLLLNFEKCQELLSQPV